MTANLQLKSDKSSDCEDYESLVSLVSQPYMAENILHPQRPFIGFTISRRCAFI